MRYICLSYPLSETTPSYGNGAKPILRKINSMKDGATSNKTKIDTDSHLGTHMDFPYHFLIDGKKGEEYDPSDFVFKNPTVAEVDVISGLILNEHLGHLSPDEETDLLIIKTGAGSGRNRYGQDYWNNGPGMGSETASLLKKLYPKLRAIGFDFISLTSFQNREEGRKAHREYLGNQIWIIEDMDLNSISAETNLSEVIVAPMLFDDCDGAPVYVLAKAE